MPSASTRAHPAIRATRNRACDLGFKQPHLDANPQRLLLLPFPMKLSVVMPVYNEQATLREVVDRVLAAPLDVELICVDDGSTDGSREILSQLQASHAQVRVFLQ